MNTKNKLKINNSFCWERSVDEIAVSFNMDKKERDLLQKNKVARLIGVIPFLAGCENPERTGLSNIATYIIAAKGSKKVFKHSFSDNESLLKRLFMISHFQGGDQAIIRKGMMLLALNMIHGYKRDCDKDRMKGEYNPVLSRAWDYNSLVQELSEEIRGIDCHEMDKYMSIEHTAFAYWSYT